MRLCRVLLLAAALTGLARTSATAGRGADPPPSQAALLARLGRPARLGPTREALRDAMGHGGDWALPLAKALGEAGGPHALRALDGLSKRREADVLIAVFEAYEQVDLRSARALETLRDSLGSLTRDDVRHAAVRALGQLGDGRDVPALLDLAFGEDEALRPVALHALQRLSGRCTPEVEARWRAWAESLATREVSTLRAALDVLEDVGEEELRPCEALHVRELRRLAWVDVPAVTAALKAWLGDYRGPRLSLSLELVGTLRLSELSVEVARVMRRNGDPQVVAEARAVLDSLSYVPPEDS